MRTKKQIFMLLLALLVGIPTLSAQQSKKEKKEQKKEAVMKLIESENYKIDVNTAMPMRGRSIPLTSSYSLTIRNDSVISYLPYYGRAYSIPYGGGDGLNFKAILKEYNVEMDKKGNAVIKFVARNPEDRYEFRAKVFPNGSASIDVNMHTTITQPFKFRKYSSNTCNVTMSKSLVGSSNTRKFGFRINTVQRYRRRRSPPLNLYT